MLCQVKSVEASEAESKVAQAFNRRASRYDFAMKLFNLVGYRYGAYRRRAVKALELRPGDTVVEICCGTGINFSLLRKAIGPSGKIVGVDQNSSMLAEARARAEEEGWKNVELVQCNAEEFSFPEKVDGVLSTYALGYIKRFEDVVVNGCNALAPGRHLSILDLKSPSNRYLSKVVSPLIVLLLRNYGVADDYIAPYRIHGVEKIVRQSLEDTLVRNWYLDSTYVISGRSAGR